MSNASAKSSLRTAWLVVALLVPVALLNYLDRQMLAAMKLSMVTDIADISTKAHWGIVLGSFKWVYAVLSPVGGYLADRLNRKWVIISSLFVWSAVTWATAHVSSFNQLVATRALMGVSEAFYIPAALALITDFHVGQTRSKAVGFHQMGIYAGIIIGGFAGYVAENPNLGWRFAFNLCGIAGILYAVPLMFLLPPPPPRADDHVLSSPLQSLRELFSNFDYILLVLYFTLPALAGWVVKDWMPDILREKFDLGQGAAGVSAVLYVQLASLVGVGIGGWLADRWVKKTNRGRIYVSAIGMSFFLPALFGVGNATTLAVAIGFLVLFGLGWGFFDCNNMPILCQITRPHLRATGYGIMNLVSISCGGFADLGFGALRDRQVPLNVIFGAFAGVAGLSILIVLLIRPRENIST
ncbi:MFS transporter [Planctomicrobium piriforme]|uniref:Sugar phosphate permease n=1 Tax=Planctomicrobium piriforme TaxID=1576369 RepID=A0A1I3QX44_9PLAN|nr:MFS transporter [Planctomicrobium piriforme]SFJ37706.1 Sugar phosphate permease [Planctomicrobium piriforme]